MLSRVKQFFSDSYSYIKNAGRSLLKGIKKMASRTRHAVPVIIPVFDIASETDVLHLDHGQHEVEIVTQQPVKSVWFSFEEDHCQPVCQGSVDMVGVNLLENGFVVYGKIESSGRGIRWFAVYRDHVKHDDEE